MSTSFQNKTSALFASVSRGVATAASKNHSYASAMSNVNINNNNIINNNNTTTTSFTMASNSHLSKGLSLLGGLGSLASGHLQSHNNNNMNNNNNNNNENNNNNNNNNGSSRNDIVLSGYLRKFKTMKKKFFVLYSDSCDRPARLEYFDSEKKFRSHSNHPKRSIVLQSCFNINRKTDTKHKCVIALYTKDDSFCIVYDNEQELNKWLHKMLALQNGEEAPEGEPPRPTFEHVWSVQVQRKGIAESKGILGCYHLCLTEKTLTLNRFGPPTTNAGEPRLASVEFLLTTIRKCGNLNCFFYMEVGRHSVIGAGELWMETEDALIAENMHSTIIKASTGPGRPRSSSANEASKPLFMNTRRQTHTGTKPMNFSPSSSSTMGGGPGMAADGAGVLTGNSGGGISISGGESPPNSRPSSPSFSTCSSTASTIVQAPNYALKQKMLSSLRMAKDNQHQHHHQHHHSIDGGDTGSQYAMMNISSSSSSSTNNNFSNDNLSNNNNNNNNFNYNYNNNNYCNLEGVGGGVAGGGQRVTLSAVVHCSYLGADEPEIDAEHLMLSQSLSQHHQQHNRQDQIHHQNPPTSDAAAPSTTSSTPVNHFKSIGSNDTNNYQKMVMGPPPPSTTNSTTSSSSDMNKLRQQDTMMMSLYGMAVKRERCDSLPSRNRTISDGGPTTTSFAANTSSTSTAMPPPKTIPSLNRPHSMYNRHSNSPLSPSMCSESDGSSISIDEPDGPIHLGTPDDNSGYFSRFSGPTPNNAILEESDEYWNNEKAAKRSTERIVRGHVRTGSGVTSSLSLPIAQGQASNSKLGKHNGGEHQGVSPAMHGTSSDGHSNYMDMYSPSGSSPGDPIGNSGYLPMSPGVDLPRSLYTGSSSTHSRASSLTEENLEMAMKDEQYVDMDMSHNQHNVHGHSRAGGLSSAASSSSITSGTPSTDTRFADYPLEKVCAQFGPDEDDNSTMSERPLRAYSVGSRMEHNKRKFRIDHSLSSSLASNSSSNSRMRAFSVGSRAKVPRSDQYKSSCMGSTPAQIAMMNSMMNDNNNNKNGKKSSSVPMLDNVTKCDKSSKGSNEELMNDFMELDFSASVSPAGKISEGMDEDQNMQVDIVTTPIAVPQPSSVANHDYLNVMPTSYCKPITKIDGYVEMHPVGLMNNSVESISSSPVKHPYSALLKAGASVKSNLPEEGNYLDMRGKDSGSSTASPKTSQQSSLPKLGSTKPSQESDYLNMSPLNRDLSSNPTSTNVPSSQVFPSSKLGKSAEEGYLEMSFSRQTSHHSTASNSSSSSEFQRQQEKFIHQRKSMMNNPANSIRSLPIDINYSATNYNGTNKKTPDSTTPITPRNTVGVLSKFSSEDSPYLPANVSNIQTPSNKMTTSTTSTPTIFPFSPGSPSTDKKPNFSQQPRSTASSFSSYGKAAQTAVGGVIAVGEIVTARKCLVDGTTGTIKLSEAEDEVNRPVVTMKIGNSVENSQTDDGDYVNCAPASFQVVVKPELVKSAITVPSNGGGMDDDLDGDYVLMNPKTKIRRKSSNNGPDLTTMSTQSLNLSSSTSHLTTTKPLSVNTTNNSSSTNSLKSSINFRPIPSSADKQVIMQQQLDSANLKGLLNRQFSLNTVDEARSDLNSNYELLRTTSGGSGSDLSSIVRGGSANNSKRGISSRPSSVNSDKITSRISTLSLNRPNSANSDRLSTISSSSSSTSTLCGGGSSSSSSTMTLCGTVEMQKSQSPMSTLRLNSSSSDANEGQMANGQLTSRPPSVTSEKELHYASLDLPPCSVTPLTPSSVAPLATQEPDFITSSGSSSNLKRNRNSIDSSSSSSATTTPSPNVNTSSSQPVSAFNYAQIDFDKCETIKQQPQPQQPPQ